MGTIVVAGATGRLGSRIVRSLVARGADVRALVRPGRALDVPGATVLPLDLADGPALVRACSGVDCVVSALQGLDDVIIGVQSALVDAAVEAGVPRFVPSDYSVDFTRTREGENRNLDFRRAFHRRLEGRRIRATSIYNGAFTELLNGRMPVLDLAEKCVRYWGDADQPLDFTTMDDTAAFTAAAALDPSTPGALRIAGDTKSAREICGEVGALTGTPFALVRLGSLEELTAFIERERAAAPESERHPYPRWQGAQYLRDMFSGRGRLEPLDNDRYPMAWTTIRDVLAASATAAGG